MRSLRHLQDELDKFGGISGLKVNTAKSEIYPIRISPEEKLKISATYPFRWVSSSWRYLGVQIPVDLLKLLQVNYHPMLEEIKTKLRHCHKTVLSWPDKMHIVRTFVFPKFLFLFRTLPIHIPPSEFWKWQKVLSDFIWGFKCHRIVFSKLTRPLSLGGLKFTCLE